MKYKNFEIRPVPESQDENIFELVNFTPKEDKTNEI